MPLQLPGAKNPAVLISVSGWALFGQTLDAPVLGGMALIAAGVTVINVSSKSAH